jgi:hypothetical protein
LLNVTQCLWIPIHCTSSCPTCQLCQMKKERKNRGCCIFLFSSVTFNVVIWGFMRIIEWCEVSQLRAFATKLLALFTCADQQRIIQWWVFTSSLFHLLYAWSKSIMIYCPYKIVLNYFIVSTTDSSFKIGSCTPILSNMECNMIQILGIIVTFTKIFLGHGRYDTYFPLMNKN